MSTDAIELILESEETARRAAREAEQAALLAVESARAAGRESVTNTIARAESEVKQLRTEADKKSAESARELFSTTANRRATMYARAENRMESAVKIIVERIVGG
jgi:vacuolar-type H+-ATPase subunit H